MRSALCQTSRRAAASAGQRRSAASAGQRRSAVRQQRSHFTTNVAPQPSPKSATQPQPPPRSPSTPLSSDFPQPQSSPTTQKLIKFAFAFAFATGSLLFFQYVTAAGGGVSASKDKKSNNATAGQSVNLPPVTASQSPPVAVSSILDAMGNTPLVEVTSLSHATGRRIFAKMENLNPGGSVKDRAARAILQAIHHQRLQQGVDDRDGRPVIVDATGGNTGVALAMLAPMFGYDCLFVYPQHISVGKVRAMEALGARCIAAPSVPFSNPNHFYHKSHSLAAITPNSYHTQQFENEANWRAHYTTTAPEIVSQLGGKIDGFVAASGTGGTLGGCSAYFKDHNASVVNALIDPPQSGFYHYLHTGQWIGRFKDGDLTVVEGIGIYRLTKNMNAAKLDRAFAGDEREAIQMAHHVLRHDGLFVGPSAALNLTGAVKLARQLPAGSSVVTIICDGGENYTDKLFSSQWLRDNGMSHVLQTSSADLSWVSDGDLRPLATGTAQASQPPTSTVGQ